MKQTINKISNFWIKQKEQYINTYDKAKKYFFQFKYLKKAFLIITLIYLLAFCTIYRANYNYIDDLGRTFEGYRAWNGFSRYTSQYLSTYIHTSTHLSDISPLTQILAILMLSLSCCIIIHVFSTERKVTFSKIMAVLPVGISPFFLECISYKFDSPYMALSIFAMVFPTIFIKYKYIKSYIVSSILGTLIMCTSYQASSGIYIVMVMFIALMMWNNKDSYKEIFKFIGISAASYGIAWIIYKIFIMVPVDGYVSTKIYPISQIAYGCIKNLKEYYSELVSCFRNKWLLLMVIINVGFICITTIKSKRNKLLAVIINFIVLVASYIFAFGLYIVLEKPLIAPRAMFGFGVVIALIAVQSCDFNNKEIFIKGTCMVLSYFFIVFAFMYGNALAEQKRYTDFRVQLVIQDLNELSVMNEDEQKSIEIKGDIGKSPVIENNNINILNILVPNTFGEKWFWAEYYFRNYFDLKNVNGTEKHDDVSSIPIVKETMYHIIRCQENYICIQLK